MPGRAHSKRTPAAADRRAQIHARAVELLGDGRTLSQQDIDELEELRRSAAQAMTPRGSSSYVPYPATDDPDLQTKLGRKLEFAEHLRVAAARSPAKSTADELWSERCTVNASDGTFELSRHQLIVRNFLAPGTPYNGLLLYHEVGIGKTCAAVTVAEACKDLMRGVLVIVRPSLRDNFKRTIFDIDKVAHKPDGKGRDWERPTQCTGTAYIDAIPDIAVMSPEQVSLRAERMIRSKYSFVGLTEFSNMMDQLTADASDEIIAERIRSRFSDMLIIVEEAHNMRGDNDKKVTQMLIQVLQIATGTKLLLMTATPMYNRAADAIDLLNLLLANDKRPLVSKADFFDAQGHRLLPGEPTKRFRRLWQGYVSYAAARDPFSYPARLAPSVSGDKAVLKASEIPTLDLWGAAIPSSEKNWPASLGDFEVIASPLGKQQVLKYSELRQRMAAMDMDIEYDDDGGETGITEDASSSSSDKLSHTIREGMQLSNLALPTGFARMEDAFVRKDKHRPIQLEYRSGAPRFLEGALLRDYAPKIAAIADRIESSRGVVMVYSQFLWRGLVPLAIALEHRGFMRHGAPQMLSGAAAKQRPLSYVIICGSRDIRSPGSVSDTVATVTHPNNRDGSVVKVVLISDSGSEGIDLKFIREVHIMEPWYHINKVEQVVGRGERFCSHALLPMAQRNLTVYLHAVCMPSGKDSSVETVDLRAYRIAANKQDGIRAVEANLREVAIDSQLQTSRGASGGPDELPQETSQGKHVVYQQKRAKVAVVRQDALQPVDVSTYDPEVHTFQRYRHRSIIRSFFAKHVSGTFDDIWKHMQMTTTQQDGYSHSRERLADELTAVIDNRVPVVHTQSLGNHLAPSTMTRLGRVIQRSTTYVFQPDSDPIEALTDRERDHAPPPTIAIDAGKALSVRQNKQVSVRPYLPPDSRTVPGLGVSSVSSVSSSTISKRMAKKLLPIVITSHTAAQQYMHELFSDVERFFGTCSAAMGESYRLAAIDAVVDRLPHGRILQTAMATHILKDAPGANADTIQHVASSLVSAGLLSPIPSPAGGPVIVRSPYYPDTALSLDPKSGVTSALEPSSPITFATPSVRLTPTVFGITTAVVPLQKTGNAVFKVLNNTRSNLKLVETGRGSGCVCHQNAFLTSQKLNETILHIIGHHAGSAILDAMPSTDKRVLCTVMELAIRKHAPNAILRVGCKLTL